MGRKKKCGRRRGKEKIKNYYEEAARGRGLFILLYPETHLRWNEFSHHKKGKVSMGAGGGRQTRGVSAKREGRKNKA